MGRTFGCGGQFEEVSRRLSATQLDGRSLSRSGGCDGGTGKSRHADGADVGALVGALRRAHVVGNCRKLQLRLRAGRGLKHDYRLGWG